MKKFASFMRLILLLGLMIVSLVAFMMRLDVFSFDIPNTLENISPESSILVALYGFALLYVFFSVVSILIRIIRRKVIDNDTAMRESYSDVVIFHKNHSTINFFRKLSFWGVVMLIINIFVLNVPFSMIYGGPFSSNAFISIYHGFLFWSVFALVFLFVVTLFCSCLWLPHYGEGAYNSFQLIGKSILSDVLTPFDVIKHFVLSIRDGEGKGAWLFRLIVMLLFIVVNVLAILLQLGIL